MSRLSSARGRNPWAVRPSRVRALAREIGRRFRAERVILFGSYARGRATRDSDVDLMVILRTRRDPVDVATDIRCALNVSFPLDILVRTPGEVRWRMAERECFMREVMETGKVLYEAHHARVG